MLRSQSDFSARNHPIDQSFRPIFEPTKRVKRPFYVPERVNDMERVFSEYDWKNHRFTSTLRPIPQSRPASASPPPCNAPSDSTMFSEVENRRTTTRDDRVSNSSSAFLPKHISRGAPDETLTSSYLLSSASSPSPPSTTSEWEHSSPYHSSSPIAQNDTEQSPLGQSMLANAEVDREFRLPSRSATFPLKQSQEIQHRHHRRRVTVEEHPVVRTKEREITSPGRSRSCTWSSDVTAVAASDYASGQKGKLPAVELNPEELESSQRISDSPRLWPVRTSEEIWRNPRRRRSLMRSSSAFARLDHLAQAEFEEEEEEEEDTAEETSEPQTENRLSSILSAIHYQYVSVGLKIQLAVHRTEKKVTRRLSDKRKNRHSDFL